MHHPTIGHITYQVNVYTYGERKPYQREFETWQSAYAYVKREIRDNAAGHRQIDVIKHRSDGFVFQGIFRWFPHLGRTV